MQLESGRTADWGDLGLEGAYLRLAPSKSAYFSIPTGWVGPGP